MSYRCKKCGKECVWLKHKDTNKPAPIEAEPSENGNIYVRGGLYRMVSKEEKQLFLEKRKPLYLNHFATCEFAKNFAK